MGLRHDRRRQRTALRSDRQRRERDHVRVAAEEEVLEEDLAREAGVRVVLAAVHLREDRAEERLVPVLRHQVILEVMTLDVEDELLARKCRPRRVRIECPVGGDVPKTAKRWPAEIKPDTLQ